MFRSPFRHPWMFYLGAFTSCLVLGGSAGAQTPDEVQFRDLWQTVQARKALLDDPQLGALNLGVQVTNGTAVLWGPVPSQALSVRAEQRLRAMVELVEVRNRMAIEPEDLAGSHTPTAPEAPRYLPDPLPSAAPTAPKPAVVEPNRGVVLAGIVTPDETLTARSSPLGQNGFAPRDTAPSTVRLPFLGSITLPR